jgi:hypothetical protein
MEKRKALSGYRRTQENRTRAINQLHGLFVRAGITTAAKSNLRFADLADAEGRNETIRQLKGFKREEAEYLAGMPGACERRIGELEQRMAEQAKGDEDSEAAWRVRTEGSFVVSLFFKNRMIWREILAAKKVNAGALMIISDNYLLSFFL